MHGILKLWAVFPICPIYAHYLAPRRNLHMVGCLRHDVDCDGQLPRTGGAGMVDPHRKDGAAAASLQRAPTDPDPFGD